MKVRQNKGNVAMDTFLDFTDVSSYLILKLSAWKRGCTISFELQMPPTSSNLFKKALRTFYQEKWKLQPPNGRYNFLGSLNFFVNFRRSIITSFDEIYLHMFTHGHVASFLKSTFLWNLTFFDLKNKPIQTKIISFTESTFKLKLT